MSERRDIDRRLGDRQGPEGQMVPDCQTVAEFLPWLLNGSLDGRERASIQRHLAGCADCRLELEESAWVWQTAGEHIPSFSLAEFAQGLPTTDWDRGQIERHLALCPSCRQELEWAAAGEVVDFDTAARSRRRSSEAESRPTRSRPTRSRPTRFRPTRTRPTRSRPTQWRRLAVAASFIAALVSGVWVWNLGGPGSPAPSDGVTASVSAPGPAADWPVSIGLSQSERSGEVSRPGDLFTDGFEAGSASAWSSVVQ